MEGIEVFGRGYWFNSAVMIDLSNIDEAEDHDGANYLIEVTKDHLTSYRSFLSKRGAVIIRTGYDRCLEQNRQHKADTIPFLTLEAAEYIASFPDLKVVGIDSLTVDAVGKHKAHQALQNTMIVESIPHLHNIPSNNCLDFFLQTVPIRILGATGGPVVAIAYVPVTDN